MNEQPIGQMEMTSQNPSLEVVHNNALATRDTITDLERVVQAMEDYLNGPRPEKEMGGQVDSCPSGMLANICQIGASSHDRLMQVHRRMAGLAQNIGVSQ